MIDLFGVHRADDANVIGNGGKVRKEVGYFLTGLAIFFEFHEWTARFQRGVLQLGELLAFGERFWKRLPVDAFQFGFEVEAFQMRRPARHAEMNDAPGAGGEMRRIDEAFPTVGRSCVGGAEQLRIEETSQRHAAEAVGGATEEGAAVDAEVKLVRIKVCHKLKIQNSKSQIPNPKQIPNLKIQNRGLV